MRFEKLEALRGFAALYVVLHHTISHSTTVYGFNVGLILRFGQEAVILFFLLSGFVINYSYRTSTNKTFKYYFSRRLLRIYIPLLVVFLVAYLSESYNAGSFINPDLINLGKNLLMLQDWDVVKPNVLAVPYLGNTPLWSLSYEWWFYMLYFPIVSGFKNRVFRDTLILFVCVAAASLYVYYPNFVTRLLTYLIIWWSGVQLSDLYLDKKLGIRGVLLPLSGIAIVAGILLLSVWIFRKNGGQLLLGFHPLLEFRHVTAAGVMIVAGVLWRYQNWRGFDRILGPFLWLAPISYVLYICHINLMVNAQYLDWIANLYLRWFAYMGCLLVFSAVVELKLYPWVRDLVLRRN